MPSLFLFSTIYENPKYISYITRFWSKTTLYCSLIFPEIIWEEKLDENNVYIFCPNHTSTLDIPFIFSIIKSPIQFMGKAELTRIPVFGYFFKKNSVIVDRKNLKDSYDAFKKSAVNLKNGVSMCIFPEGGIPKEKVFLKKFKNGAFKLACEESISIVPITIADNKKKFPKSYFKGGPGIVRVTVHKSINPKNFTVDNINNYVYNIIFEKLKKYENN
tara:strand:- start:459 stop:1109 length:651 start_codon:yes stop_codon:yes gene_type:complete